MHVGACVNMCGVHVRTCVRVHVCVQLKLYLHTDAYLHTLCVSVCMCVYIRMRRCMHVLCMHVGINRVQCITVLQVTVQPHEYCICQQHCCCVLVVCFTALCLVVCAVSV